MTQSFHFCAAHKRHALKKKEGERKEGETKQNKTKLHPSRQTSIRFDEFFFKLYFLVEKNNDSHFPLLPVLFSLSLSLSLSKQ